MCKKNQARECIYFLITIEFKKCHWILYFGQSWRKCKNDIEGKERGVDKFWERGSKGTLTIKKDNKTKEEQNNYWESEQG